MSRCDLYMKNVVMCCRVVNIMCMVSMSWVIFIILVDDIEYE